MKMARIAVSIAVGGLLLVLGGPYLASEFGEVVVVESRDAEGQARRTRVWIVDDADVAWIRGSPSSGWVQRALANPEVLMTRRGSERHFRAVPERDRGTRERVNALMREKYRLRDRYIALTLGDPDRSGVLPFRLEPGRSASSPDEQD